MKTINFKYQLLTIFTFISISIFASKTDSIQIIVDQDQLILPNQSFKIGVISYKHNGKEKRTFGMPGGNTFWWNYEVKVIGGTFSSGKITVNEQLSPSKGKFLEIEIYPKKEPELAKTAYIPLNYETELRFFSTKPFDKAPGCKIEGEIVTYYDNNKYEVFDKLKRDKEAENFRITTYGGYWNNGAFTIDQEICNIIDHQVGFIVQPKNNLFVADTFWVQLDYNHDYNVRFTGRSGPNGLDGSDGWDGSTGNNGNDGQNGENGYWGENGPDIGVWVDAYFDSILNTPLLYVFTENFWTNEEYRYLVNPENGSFKITSEGGRGGDGGDGGDGGNGGRGEDGKVYIEKKVEEVIVKKPFKEKKIIQEKKKITTRDGEEKEITVEREVEITVYKDVVEKKIIEVKRQGKGHRGGDGGWGGAGGLAGIGGNGGTIFLHFTEDALPYQNKIIARSNGGSGGRHGDGGDAGSGGQGGSGNPNGRKGWDGKDGPEAFGWADDGYDGEIIIEPTDEFFFYETSSIDK